MNRWLPFPLSSAALAVVWLLLNQSLELAHLLLAAAAGFGGGLLLAKLQVPGHRVRRRLPTAARLLLDVLVDIVRSNIAVARIVFQPSARGRVAGFLSIPLDLRHPGGLAVLACIVTATPGTSWARYDATRNVLTLHVLDLVDEDAWVTQFKQRYEKALMEIFL